jgi:RES domain-containing protein
VHTDEQIRERVDAAGSSRWEGVVFRHVLGDTPPLRENRWGARWNPRNVPAIYASLERDTCIAEVAYRVSLDVVKPRSERRLYSIQVNLKRVVDLQDRETLTALGFTPEQLKDDSFAACQQIGDAVAWLGNDGLLVPSFRAPGTNMVIFPHNHEEVFDFPIVGLEVLPAFEDDDAG